MKIRNDYVSNSSSSSFILANCEMFDYFKVTKDDILNALIDSYGKKEYEKANEEFKRYANEKDNCKYYKEFVDNNQYGPFFVYDLADKKDKKVAEEMWGNLLSGWTANNCHTHGKKVYYGHEPSVQYREIMERIGEVYNFPGYCEDDKMIESVKKFVRSDKMNKKTHLYGKYVPLDKEVVEFVKNLHKTCGIMSNLDVLKSKVSRFFVHADDNEIWTKDTAKKAGRKWESEYYTYDRVCEILFKYLVKIGRIVPEDPKFKKLMLVPEDDLSKWDKEHGYFYYFKNGKNLTWEDIQHITLTWCMHEG